MWRTVIPLLISVGFSVNLWFHSGPQTRRFIVLLYSTLGSLMAAWVWAERHPETAVSRVLLAFRGPRTDVSAMTKSELYGSGCAFFRVGAGALVLSVLIGYFLASTRSAVVQTVLLALLPFVLFPTAMGLIGGIYLTVRAALRRKPPNAV